MCDDIRDEDSSDLGRLFRSLVSGGRAENHGYDPQEVKNEAQALYDVLFNFNLIIHNSKL